MDLNQERCQCRLPANPVQNWMKGKEAELDVGKICHAWRQRLQLLRMKGCHDTDGLSVTYVNMVRRAFAM